MQKNNLAKSLLEKYAAGTCTDEECATVEAWYAQWNQDLAGDLAEERLQAALTRVQLRLPKAEKKPLILSSSVWITAATIILITTFSMLFFIFKNNTANYSKVSFNTDLAPASNKAVLTLSDGKTINLNATKTAVVINANLLSYNDGTAIASTDTNQIANDIVVKYLSLHTPRGGIYQIILPDGSKVWLNAESSLKFPNTFQSVATRKVTLMGEAYFEVAKNGKPFIVETDKQEVKVLGTHFNINSYPDHENVKTTLLEGSVIVLAHNAQKNEQKTTLIPNQQSILTKGMFNTQTVDIDKIMGWKNGYFVFDGETLDEIMREISRWYDVEVVFKDSLQKTSFIGVISNTKNISTVLEAISETGNVRFKLDGRRVVVMK